MHRCGVEIQLLMSFQRYYLWWHSARGCFLSAHLLHHYYRCQTSLRRHLEQLCACKRGRCVYCWSAMDQHIYCEMLGGKEENRYFNVMISKRKLQNVTLAQFVNKCDVTVNLMLCSVVTRYFQIAYICMLR